MKLNNLKLGSFGYSKLVKPVLAGLLAVGVLSSCQSKDAKIDPLAGGGGLTGSWVSGDNVFTAQLRNGKFTSTANDTGEVLSEGEYIVISAKVVELTWRGRLSQQFNSANCQRDGEAVLNCTDTAGKTFTLRKSTGIS